MGETGKTGHDTFKSLSEQSRALQEQSEKAHEGRRRLQIRARRRWRDFRCFFLRFVQSE
jgi:hypothetical protein